MDAFDALRRDPSTAGVFLDFDGTLSPIVPVAADARPLPDVGVVLSHLVAVLGRVAIVSGRPVSYLDEHLPPEVELHGLYGLESRIDGERRARLDSERWRPLIDEVADDARRALSQTGVDVEHKGLSLTLHFRRVPDAEDVAVEWARAAADRTSLHLRAAKMSLELHPPVAVDKGTVVEERSDGLRSVAYIGDDVGDLPAFAALDRLAERGITSVKVAVRTSDASDPLLAQAHHLVDGPEGALDLLRSIG
ncbi:MAG: trehalose-phosphatase [Acidimicrobiales bacterium]